MQHAVELAQVYWVQVIAVVIGVEAPQVVSCSSLSSVMPAGCWGRAACASSDRLGREKGSFQARMTSFLFITFSFLVQKNPGHGRPPEGESLRNIRCPGRWKGRRGPVSQPGVESGLSRSTLCRGRSLLSESPCEGNLGPGNPYHLES